MQQTQSESIPKPIYFCLFRRNMRVYGKSKEQNTESALAVVHIPHTYFIGSPNLRHNTVPLASKTVSQKALRRATMG
jgi:hypothetical protein